MIDQQQTAIGTSIGLFWRLACCSRFKWGGCGAGSVRRA